MEKRKEREKSYLIYVIETSLSSVMGRRYREGLGYIKARVLGLFASILYGIRTKKLLLETWSKVTNQGIQIGFSE
jgi:hypothetical protein